MAAARDPAPESYEGLVRVARLTLGAAGFGLSWGALLGYLRAQNVPFYAASMGLNYALFAGTFFGTRQLLTELDPTVPRMNSAIAGSITGGVLTTVFSGPVRGLQGAVFWGIMGVGGQLVMDEISAARQRRRDRILAESLFADTKGSSPPSVASAVSSSASSSPSSSSTPSVSPSAATSAAREKWLAENAGTLGRSSEALPRAPGPADEKVAPWLPSWLPFAMLTEDEYEQKLRKRLAVIERQLALDDEYRARMRLEIDRYDRERASRAVALGTAATKDDSGAAGGVGGSRDRA